MDKLPVWSRIFHCLSKRVPGNKTTSLWIWNLQRKKSYVKIPMEETTEEKESGKIGDWKRHGGI